MVAPSLPGYGLSFRPGQKRFVVSDMADCLADLMVALGYKRFAAQGGDWGAFTASCMGVFHPDKLIGIHLNLLGLRPDLPMPAQSDAGGATVLPGNRRLAEGGDRLSVDPGHQAADPGFRADRQPSRAGRLDRGEVPHLVGQ